jgi:hypothetical protein
MRMRKTLTTKTIVEKTARPRLRKRMLKRKRIQLPVGGPEISKHEL